MLRDAWGDDDATVRRRLDAINNLRGLRIAGVLNGVWVDADVIRVRWREFGEPERITLDEAERLIQQYGAVNHERKPINTEIGSGSGRSTARSRTGS